MNSLTRMQKIGIAGACLFFGGLILLTAISPSLLKILIKQKMVLMPGSMMREIWGKIPFPIYYCFYIFNVTNADEVSNGARPIVEEIGPFVFDAWHEKINQIDYEEDDTVSFTIKNTFFFNKEKSGHFTGDEEVVVPNYFILGVVNAVLQTKMKVMPMIDEALRSLYNNPESLFIKAKVNDILFKGLPISCGNVISGPATLICSNLQAKHKEYHMEKLDDSTYLMSLFGWMNGTDSKDRVRVRRGNVDLREVGEVIEYNSKNNMEVWHDEHCDAFNGTDGTVFHPFFDEDGKDDIVSFSPSMCRVISAHYETRSEFAGMKTLRYTGDMGIDPDNNPNDRCYCPTPNDCLRKGVMDMYRCVHAPLLISNPHFYNADPYYLKTVDGLIPDKKKHEFYVDLDPFSGAILNAHMRVQFNMMITKIEDFSLMKDFPEAVLPLIWIDENVLIPDFLIDEVRFGHKVSTVAKLFEYLMMIVGIAMCAYAGYMHYKHNRNMKLEIRDIKMGSTNLAGPTDEFETRIN